METRAVDHIAGIVPPVIGNDQGLCGHLLDFLDFGVEHHVTALHGEFLGEDFAHFLVVQHRGVFDMDGGQSIRVRFNIFEMGGTDQFTADAAADAALIGFLEDGQFGFAGGDDDFAADIDGDAVILTEAVHFFPAFHAGDRFLAAGNVVDAAMEQTVAHTALMRCDSGFFLHDNNGLARVFFEQIPRSDQPNDPPAYDDDIIRSQNCCKHGRKSLLCQE